jgi:hypothetical protein
MPVIRRIILIELLCLFANLVSAQTSYWDHQSPYKLSVKKDLITGGISLSAYFTGKYIEKHEDLLPFEMGSFTQDDIDRINFIDRGVAGRWDMDAKAAGLVFKRASKIGASLGIIFLPGDLESRTSLCVIYLEGYFLTRGVTSFAKGVTDRYRPFTYKTIDQINTLVGDAKKQFLTDITGNDIEDSFFSGDASLTAYAFIFTAKAFNDYFPDSKLKYGIWGVSITGTALQAYFRAKSGKHFPTDVIVGSLVGGSIGFLVLHLHKKLEKQGLSLNPTSYGVSLTYDF